MTKFKYIPEIFCLLLFTYFSTSWVLSIEDDRSKKALLAPLLTLEILIPQHKVELLNANFSDQLHYDKLAQLQFEIEGLLFEATLNQKSNRLLKDYKETSLNYIQLTSMLKTSQRLISENSSLNDQKLQGLMDAIRLQMFAFITTHKQEDKEKVVNLLNKIDTGNTQQGNWQYLQLIKLHSLFVLDNYELTASYRQKLIEMPVIESVIKELEQLNIEIDKIALKQLIALFSVVLVFLFLFILIIKRHQSALEETSELHRKAVQVKTQFLANMSHEIRTPMTGVIGLVELTLQTDLDEEQRDYLEKIQFSADSLLVIINDILDFSKIESGKLPIEHIVWQHDKLIDNVNMMLGKVAEERGIELIFDLAPDIPNQMVGDPVRVNQILLNLLSNAIKFTEHGHVILKGSIINQQEDNNTPQILYQIKDTGIGLSEEQQSKLFQRFSQADQSTTRKYGGTGLGLAISKLLVDLMEGDINVTSQLGKGSTFSVHLPLVVPDTDIAPSAIVKQQGMRLLLLEDNKVTQGVIKKMAEYLGASVVLSATVSEAKALCHQQQFDIALVDWHLEGETGLSFIKEIKQQSCCPKKFVICSAYSQGFIEKNSTIDDAILYLAKPLTVLSLSKVLNNEYAEINPAPSQVQLNNQHLQPVKEKLAPQTDHHNTILLVEDNKINQLIASKLLIKLGLNVDVAENGQEAIEMIENNNYRVVLMDIQMPIMDGKEATIELRKTYSTEQLNIIALTANITEEHIVYYKEIGMNGHLGKPYELEKIREILTVFYSLND
ncbi:hypothetical protein GCM10007916_13550 [Psychromonas marina]|uniref:histidine kinase n=1 Tax=Psychromonas marina TaxID=88364 RepID=A0ABQ6DYR4_9GAMM|nr:response regulator [Psychromonas marina]GLS90288.1 hypothetical protein GCM10007916_13550 [Psychromonas marina]